MKRLSQWAYNHPRAARLLIVLCYVVLNATGLLLGDLLLLLGVHLGTVLLYGAAAVAALALILYPQRKDKHRYRRYYLRQKSCDGLLIATTFLLVLSAANLRQQANTPFHVTQAGAVVPAAVHYPGSLTPGKPAEKGSFFKSIKNRLAHAFQKVRHYYKAISTRDKILLTALLALLAVAAMYGVIAWACSLSCSGSEAVGWIVLIAGTGAVIFLVMWAGRAINRAYRRRRERREHTSAG